jgi:asparagine synthase (glutamine-hydrolysing)
VRAGNWIKAWQHLQREGRWRSQLWWEFILPYLAPHWQRQWFARCQRKTLALPVWLTPHYVQSESVQLALQEYYRGMMLPEGLQQALTFATESGYAAASGCMNALLYSSFRLRTVSPLQDRRLIEFVLKLPPSLQSDPIYEKKFLRQVNQDHLPLQILLRHKENYFDPMKYAGIAQGSQPLELLEVLKNMPLLESIIDFNRVKETLFLYREEYVQEYCPGRPYLNGEATYLYNLFAFINWYQNVTLHLSCYASEPPVLI